jgi:hypothetical protein
MSCFCRSCVPRPGGGICCGVLGILRAKIWCAAALIPSLIDAVLWFGAPSSESFGILHIVAFITLCEAYMGIEPHFNLWNYFFRVWLRSDSDTKVVVWGCADIYVSIGPRIDPYFRLSVSNPSVGWQKEWFFLRNVVSVPLHAVMGKRPTVQPSWEYGVAKKDTRKLQPMRDVL